MKKSMKSFISAALAGIISLTSTVSAFAASRTYVKYEIGDVQEVVTGFLHGDGYLSNSTTNDYYSHAGYDFAGSGLPNTSGHEMKAANFVTLDIISNKSGSSTGSTAKGQVAYCISPSKSANTNSFNVTLKEPTEANLGITAEMDELLTKALMVGYTGTEDMVLRNAGFDGNLRWMTAGHAPLPLSGYSYTSQRIATQILVWMIKQGWYGNSDYESRALAIFTKELPTSPKNYKQEVIGAYNQLKQNMSSAKVDKAYNALEEIEEWFKLWKEDKESVYSYKYDEKSGLNIYTITLSNTVNDYFPTIENDIKDALAELGFQPNNYIISKSGNTITIKTKTAIPENALTVKPNINTSAISGIALVDSLVGFEGSGYQDVLVPNVPTFEFTFGEGEHPIPDTPQEFKLTKTWNGSTHKAINFTDYNLYTFKIGYNLVVEEDPVEGKYYTTDESYPSCT